MSIKDAMLEIVADMEERVQEAKSAGHGEIGLNELVSYAKQMRRVCTAAGDPPALPTINHLLLQTGGAKPAALQHYEEVEKAKAEFRRNKTDSGLLVPSNAVGLEESHDGEMVEVRGGPAADGSGITYHPIDTGFTDEQIQQGVRCLLAGGIYKLHKDGTKKWLEYDAETTEKEKAKRV